MTNAIITAVQAAQSHIEKLTSVSSGKAERKLELEKMTKAQLVELILSGEKFQGVKIEDMVKPILEDPACAWLDYETIVSLIKAAVPTCNTSTKCLASYSSKYPKQKGWVVVPRKSAADRQAAIFAMALNR